ncbi:MAG: TAXI family TRAP transporter solute-binding subunit [Pseudomonadota bacterium]|nr:TAXI family TRAP transporter solute-binding subunit [Pseudomonadota bacterium]
MKSSTPRILAAATAFVAGMVLSTVALADDFKWPRLLVIGTPGTASGAFASTNGWAPIFQNETGVTVRVVPEDSEPQRYRRLVERKDIAISSSSAAEMASQLQGVGGYATTPAEPMRILWHHNDTPWGWVVAGDSKLKSLDDLKQGGFRVTRAMFSPTMVLTVDAALPAFLGMSKEEVEAKLTYVPASSYAESCRSVVEGKSDVAFCAPISSVLSEMEGAPGSIRWLGMPLDDAAGWDRYLSHRPMHIPAETELGVATARGVPGPTSNFVYTVTADADADFVYNMAKWMHKSYDAYKDTHPLAARMSMTQFRKYLDRTPIPVHEGTVRYLREIGQWTEADDAWNTKAIDLMAKWNAARKAAINEAREKKVELDFKNPEFIALLEKHTAGLEVFRSRL